MDSFDCQWIGKQLFESKTQRGASINTQRVQLWTPPPPPGPVPSPTDYFGKGIFMWCPKLKWAFVLKCPICSTSLTYKGLYPRVRTVLSITSYYYLAGESYECRNGTCKNSTFISYDQRLRDQLPIHLSCQFPIIMTWKSACDTSVVSMLRSRTLGNSPTAHYHNILEMHSDTHMRNTLTYLHVTTKFNEERQGLSQTPYDFPEPPRFKDIPKSKWFLACYVRDVWSRLDYIKASITSTYGSVLKIDSTKKICKKLAGQDANTASWVTNVANERGEILQSVVTTSESSVLLKDMADGLMKRYRKANEPQPTVMYTDRDCCSINESSKLSTLFHEWADLEIRLDIWHFMRRIAVCVTSESHPLYATFMGQLSDCIFVWDAEDYSKLKAAKAGMLREAGMRRVSEIAVMKAITKEEMAQHCKRRTRGAEETICKIENLLLTLSDATDALGVPLLKEDSNDVWMEQKKHVGCIQDMPGLNLYTITHTITKGGSLLPVYRCARGSTSLESFHLHLAR